MNAPPLDVLPGLRAAILAVPEITSRLAPYNGSFSVHTRRPVPDNAPFPMIVIGPTIARTDDDGLSDFRPTAVIDINTYGPQPDRYRDVEAVAERIYGLFHRQASALEVDGYAVTDIRCTGPSPAPVDDESRVGRRVTLTIRLYAKP
ncbi:hypothetical protein [Chelativorans sp. AA-79]|uniref:hypothetical protein n=1 Tax=Chelativorans sp. AA-79 TaxID=3028735 RepID=UPI0023F9578C|nr:hypothetical protein [Chelativorans sp. AA-79]WEX10281.1 hypothetical protein PVE73_04800 [Chelativorans sp. AA-79]